MLVLTRKVGEGIAIGDDVRIVVMQIKGKQVRLGIKASPTTVVHREEIYQKIQDENRMAANSARPESVDRVSDLLGKETPATGSPFRRREKRIKDEED